MEFNHHENWVYLGLVNEEQRSRSCSLQPSQTSSWNFCFSFNKFSGMCFYKTRRDRQGCVKDPSCPCTTYPFLVPQTQPKDKSAQAKRIGNNIAASVIVSILREHKQRLISNNLEVMIFLPQHTLGKAVMLSFSNDGKINCTKMQFLHNLLWNNKGENGLLLLKQFYLRQVRDAGKLSYVPALVAPTQNQIPYTLKWTNERKTLFTLFTLHLIQSKQWAYE